MTPDHRLLFDRTAASPGWRPVRIIYTAGHDTRPDHNRAKRRPRRCIDAHPSDPGAQKRWPVAMATVSGRPKRRCRCLPL